MGELAVPGDKSISHRVLMLGAIAEGDTLASGLLSSDDVMSTLGAMKALGLSAESAGDSGGLVLRGLGLHGLREPRDIIDAGNSGTTARLLAGILAGQPFFSALTGDEYLRRRPMGRVTEPLARMGARITGREGASKLPIAIVGGGLAGVEHAPGEASAQVKSAILLAGLYADGVTAVTERMPTRDHTERMMEHMGVSVVTTGLRVSIEGGQKLRGAEIEVPGDMSSAAFFIAAALVNPGSEVVVRNVGINPLRSGVIDVLRRMGADIELEASRSAGGEPVADIVARHSVLRGVEIGGEEIPRTIDELPVIAALAALAEGETRIRDSAELRHKETDRIAAMTAELGKLGASVTETEDGMVIRGVEGLRGAECKSWGDHRVAMALAVAATRASGETVIEDAGSVSVSFPGFFEHLERLR